jgi:hypothetical protein
MLADPALGATRPPAACCLSQAFKAVQAAGTASGALAAGAFLALAVLLGRGAAPASGGVAGAAAGLLAALLARHLLALLERRFVFVDYVHARHH